MLKDESDLVWSSRQTQAVQELKQALVTTIRVMYDPEKPPAIETSASKYGTGALIGQEEKPIAFESRKSGQRARLLPGYEGELLAIVRALAKWRQLIGSKT